MPSSFLMTSSSQPDHFQCQQARPDPTRHGSRSSVVTEPEVGAHHGRFSGQ
jgi:hypothetical protein